jgi:N-methylhydantoinase A
MTRIKSRYRLGVDVGGTHTDLVLLDVATGGLLVEKVASTPKNPALAAAFDGRLTAPSLEEARARFDTRHAQIHGHAAKDRPIEVVSYRLRLRVAVPKYVPREEARPASPPPASAARKGERLIYFDGRSATPALVYERDRLAVGATIEGAAIIEQFDATTIVPPGWSGRVDERQNLVLERRKA